MESTPSVVPTSKNAGFEGDTATPLMKSQTPVPLRILIDRDLIGAVMGHRKTTAKQIASETRTR